MANGEHNVICDLSGFKVKSTDTKKMWNGLRVHKDFYEPRNPQDTLIVHADDQSVDDPRPEQPDRFLEANEVTQDSL